MVEAFFGSGGPACTVTNVERTCSAPTGEDILAEPLSRSQWRVIDRRLPDNDAGSVLGFIEEKADASGQLFEVLQLGQGVRWFTFPTLVEALNHFSAAPDSSTRGELEFSSSHPQASR